MDNFSEATSTEAVRNADGSQTSPDWFLAALLRPLHRHPIQGHSPIQMRLAPVPPQSGTSSLHSLSPTPPLACSTPSLKRDGQPVFYRQCSEHSIGGWLVATNKIGSILTKPGCVPGLACNLGPPLESKQVRASMHKDVASSTPLVWPQKIINCPSF